VEEADGTRRQLTVSDHDRDATGMRYVYAVVSRRAQGVSVGINLNPNNACNWRCVYCQVPDLVRGQGPPIDLARLERELDQLLRDIVDGDFLARRAPEGMRVLRDVAFSGNGEPTSSPNFADATDLVLARLAAHDLHVPVTLITNGSLCNKAAVGDAIGRLGTAGGRVWFKVDAATAAGAARINGQPLNVAAHLERARHISASCPTWIQTCMVALDGAPPDAGELDAYVAAMAELAESRVRGVLLYSLARPSFQPEAERLSALPREWLEALAARVRGVGMAVDLA
jgi:wyosine [tRNA(Phe)-imidazoG37] synthetase (radical SAM superfamily)